jgi:hypothetical protein
MHRVLRSCAAAVLLGILSASHLRAADDTAKPLKPVAVRKESPRQYDLMDYGPFLSASFISWPTAEFDNGPGSFTCDSTARGIAIKLSDGWNDGIVFDADTMRMAVAWHGGPIRFRGLIGDGDHGWSPMPTVLPTFQTPNGPGWANAEGSFEDPRADSIKPLPRPGPLPKNWAKYKGLYRHDDRVVLCYSVNEANVLESPSVRMHGGAVAFVREIEIEGATTANAVMIADGDPRVVMPKSKTVKEKVKMDGVEATVEKTIQPDPKLIPAPKNLTCEVKGLTAELGNLHIAVIGAPAGAVLEINATHQLYLKLPKIDGWHRFWILVSGGGKGTSTDFNALARDFLEFIDLKSMTRGGPSLWTKTVETKGILAKADPKKPEPYVVDSLTLPMDNPYHSWMRIGAFDFFPDGKRAALTTWSGDVWIVSGIDEKLEHLTWKRFATGLHQPLGCKIVDGTIYVVGHDQITRLRDLDGDGEADFYENFNNDWELTTAFHAFAFDLQTDAAGNFYFAFGSPVHAGGGGFQRITKDHGTIFKVSPDGSKIEHYAEGLRAPNGMGISPTGQITIGDNQGSWVPVDPIHWVKPGDFLGVAPSAHRPMKSTDGKADPSEQPKPLCWALYPKLDNSCGGQVWVTSDQWGPLKGELLYCSYGQSALYKVLKEEVNGVMQGGITKLTNKFTSSAMRPRFNPIDGQLYITGLKGWQSNAGKDGGFDRVRYTGAPVILPVGLHVTKKGIAITFTAPLETAAANDPGNFSAEAFNIKWSSAYGSKEYSLSVDPNTAQTNSSKRDTWTIKSATLSGDLKTVFLEIPEIQKANCVRLSYNLNAADGSPVKGEIGNTIHELAEE